MANLGLAIVYSEWFLVGFLLSYFLCSRSSRDKVEEESLETAVSVEKDDELTETSDVANETESTSGVEK